MATGRDNRQLTDAAKVRLQRAGFVSVRYSAKSNLADLAHELGHPVPSKPSGPLVDRLLPTKTDQAKPRSLSARHGTGEFPFHSEAAYYRVPPRWVLLRLADGGYSEATTGFVDVNALPLSDDLMVALRREIWIVSGKPGHFLSPVVNTHLSTRATIVRWDEGCMYAAQEEFQETANRFKRTLKTAD